jgi:hypothetical protein
LPDTDCDGGAHGYFTGDVDNLPEPLLFRGAVSEPNVTAPSSSERQVVSRPAQ